jgi:poly(A) polymerase
LDPSRLADIDLPGEIRFIFHRLAKRGAQAWLVGSAVRDLVLNGHLNNTGRVDMVVALAAAKGIEQSLAGAAGDKVFLSPMVRNGQVFSFEARDSEGQTIKKFQLMQIGSEQELETTLAFREVTVNAMALDSDLNLVDPFGGLLDLERGDLRTVQPAERVFKENPLYILKVAKHAAFHRLYPGDKTVKAASREADRLLDISPNKWRPEFERMLLNRNPDFGLRFLADCGALNYILPELTLLGGFEKSCSVHHKDIFQHTVEVCRQAKPTPPVRWAALLHDVGKYWTRTVSRDGQVHFFHHEEMSAYLSRGILARLGIDPRTIDRVCNLVLNHSRITLYSADWTESAVRRLIRDLDGCLEDLVALAKADITSKREDRIEEIRLLTEELERRIAEVREKDSKEPLLAKGIGNEIMEFLGLTPGPIIGELKDLLEKAIEEGTLERGLENQQYLDYLAALIRQQGLPKSPK